MTVGEEAAPTLVKATSHHTTSILPDPTLVEVRPGRRVSLLHIPNTSSDVTYLLVHGACATWRQFSMIIPTLAEKASIVTYDVYGCGDSPKPNDFSAYSTEALLEDLKAIYRAYATQRTIVVGHSFGSSQSMRLAAWLQDSQDSRLCGLVLLASALKMPNGGHPVFDLPLPVLAAIQPVISLTFRVQAAATTAANTRQTPMEEVSRTSSRNPPYMFKAFYNQMRWVDEASVDSINVPCIIIHGESDRIITLRKARELASRLKKCKLYVFRKTGHQIMQEHPRETVHFIKKFSDQVLTTENPLQPVDVAVVPAEQLHISVLPPVKTASSSPSPQLDLSGSTTTNTLTPSSSGGSSLPHLPPLVPPPPSTSSSLEGHHQASEEAVVTA